MPGFAEKLWEMGRTPSQHLSLLVFGLVALLTGLISRSMLAVVGSAGGMAALSLAASFLVGVGGFFVTLALFLGAYTADGESWTTTVWRIAQLLAADAHERVRGEPFRLAAPGLARIRGLPYGHLPLRKDAVLPTD